MNSVKLRKNQNRELYISILTPKVEALGETSGVTKLKDKTAGLPMLLKSVSFKFQLRLR